MSKRILFLVLSALLFAQCSLWDSLTAYFNTYYNASRLFSEAEDEVWSQPDARAAGTNWLIRLDPPQSARTRFSSVIEKCSKLLQYHPESNLVDDALLLIAKSYFYQGEVQKSERKCRELLDNHPASSLCPEARVLLAYTLYKMNDMAGASRIAKDALERGEGSGDVLARAFLLLAQDEFDRQNTREALRLFASAGEKADNGDLRAVAYLRAADCALHIREFDRAQELFGDARSATGSYLIEFRATIGAIRAQIRQGKQREAIERLRELRDNQNYREFFGEVDLAMAEAFEDAGDIPSAIGQYAYVDTAYARTEYGARGGYGLGRIYELTMKQLDSALAAYNRAKSAVPNSEASIKSRERADLLAKYVQFRGDLIRTDTLLLALQHVPDSTVLRAAGKGDTISTSLRDSLITAAAKSRAVRIDSLNERRAFDMSEIANVFYTGLDLRDSAWVWYARVAEEYPASPQTSRALFVIAQILSADSSGRRQPVADSLLGEVIRRFPNSDFAAEARKRLGLPAVPKAGFEGLSAYTEAEAMILKGRGGDALPILRSIVTQTPNSPIASRAQYAIGWVYEHQLMMPDSALSAYKRLVTLYPVSPGAAAVMPMLAVAEEERRAQVTAPAPVADTVAVPTPAKEAALKTQEQRPEAPVNVTGSAGRNSGRESRLRSRRID